jgi:hypothetical protein
MAECPNCETKVKGAPGKLAICPECETKFRVPEDARRAAATKKPAAVKKGPEPAAPDDMYGFSEGEDLGALRQQREEASIKKAAENKKKEKPIIEIKRKNIGDLKVWERIDKSMFWLTAGVAVWAAAHIVFGIILFLGMVQGPEYAGPVVTKLIRPDQPPIELGAGDVLDRPGFVIAMLGGTDLYGVTLGLLLLVQLFGWVRVGLWVTGYSIAWPSAPIDLGGKGQLITLYTLAGLNFLFAFFLVFLPFAGAYSYCVMPWSGAELSMAEYNMERSLPLPIFWAFAPFWETLLTFIVLTLLYLEPIMIAYFIWTVACTLKEEPLAEKALGAVQMGFSVLFLLLVFHLFALAGSSPVLVKVLRILYVVWYVGLIIWMLRLFGLISSCRETFHFYFFPDED